MGFAFISLTYPIKIIYKQVKSQGSIYPLNVLSNDNGKQGLELLSVFSLTGEVKIENGLILFDLREKAPQPFMTLGYIVKNLKGQYSYAQANIVFKGFNSTINEGSQLSQSDINLNNPMVSIGTIGEKRPNVPLLGNEHITAILPEPTNTKYETNDETSVHRLEPVVTMGQDVITGEGGRVDIPVHLSEILSYYPVVIPYEISGTSDQHDHDLIEGEVIIEQGLSGVIPVNIFEDYVLEPDETLMVHLNKSLNASLNQGINIGDKSTYTLTIVDRNVPPTVELIVSQNEELAVMVTALVHDPNKKDQHRFSWVLEKDQNQVTPYSPVEHVLQTQAYFTFVPHKMEAGWYKLSVIVTDDDIEPLSNTQAL